MLHPASNLPRQIIWRIALGLIAWIWLAIAGLSACLAQTTVTGSIGLDAWQVPGQQARYLPDYATAKPWDSTARWGTLNIQHTSTTPIGPITYTLDAQAHDVRGGRINRLDVDARLGGSAGIRVGMLPYRVSWCEGMNGVWISEPDAFCRSNGLNEISQGGFGVQGYTAILLGKWLMDGLVGVHRPMVDGQDDKLGPYVPVGPNVSHRKIGASVNALHLPTGVQLRTGWMNTRQVQDSATGGFQRRMDYDTLFAAGQFEVLPNVDLTATISAYIGDQTNTANAYQWHGQSTTMQAAWQVAPRHKLLFAQSRYLNKTEYDNRPGRIQLLQVDSQSIAWRYERPDGWSATLQATHTHDDSTTAAQVQTVRSGAAYGVRLSKRM